METLNEIYKTINEVSKDPRVTISKKDDYTFNIEIVGNTMSSFLKLGEIEEKIKECCNDEYTLKTICGDGQNATFILKKNN